MFTNMVLKNYKSLVDFNSSFIKSGKVKDMIIIYGENGVGKSNFISAFKTLNETLNTLRYKDLFEEMMEEIDIKEVKEYDIKKILDIMSKSNSIDLENIINQNKTIGSEDNMYMKFDFLLNNKKGIYTMEFDNNRIVYESLKYVLNKNIVSLYEASYKENNSKIKFNTNLFSDKYLDIMHENFRKYWGKHTVLSIFRYDLEDKNTEYIKVKWSKELYNIVNFFNQCSYNSLKGNFSSANVNIKNEILRNIGEGTLEIYKENKLNEIEEILNDLFTQLYSDIKSVYYKKKYENNIIEYKLFFKKKIYGKLIDIEYYDESTGTLKILKLVPYLCACADGGIVLIDEIDSGIHDILVKNIVEGLYYFNKNQIFLTTHNTMLLESEELYDYMHVLSVQNEKKYLIPLSDYDVPKHPNINYRKKYMSGAFDGIPYSSVVDFEDIFNDY